MLYLGSSMVEIRKWESCPAMPCCLPFQHCRVMTFNFGSAWKQGWRLWITTYLLHSHGHWRQVHVPSWSPEAPILATKVYNRSPGTKRALPTRGAAINSVALYCCFLWFLGEWEEKGSCRKWWRQRGGCSKRSPRWHNWPDPFSRAEYDKCCFILSWKEQDSTA